ncbi:MAG: glycosyltransferase family 2 protein [Acidobacteriaceae bacterium]
MADRGLIGVVTVTYNSDEVLPGFLHSMANQTCSDFLLYVVDNASADGTRSLLSQWQDDRLRVIANAENLGVAAGNNRGIERALQDGCSLVLLINNDTEFNDRLIDLLAKGLETFKVDMVCPKIMYFDEPQRFWAAGGHFQRFLGYRPAHNAVGQIDRGQCNKPHLISYAPTCCVLLRRDVFDRVGFMDERYFVYYDDVDFMFRAGEAGVKLLYLPDALLLHKVGRLTGGEESLFSIRYGTRNRVYFLRRHLGLLRSLPVLLFYELYYAVALISGKFSPRVYFLKHKATWEGFSM